MEDISFGVVLLGIVINITVLIVFFVMAYNVATLRKQLERTNDILYASGILQKKLLGVQREAHGIKKPKDQTPQESSKFGDDTEEVWNEVQNE